MMIKKILFSLFMGMLFSAYSGQTFEDGVVLFNKKEFKKSAAKFDSIIQYEPNNTGALYNLGMAKMKNEKWGEAIWAFERVLMSTPNDVQTKLMIEECHYEIDPNFVWEYRLNGMQSTLYSFSSTSWAIMAILCSIIIAVMMTLFNRSNNRSSKRLLGIIGVMSFLLFILSIFSGYSTKKHRTANNYAIITEKSVTSIDKQKTIGEGSLLELIDSSPEDSIIRIETEEGELLSFAADQMSFL
ncbi:MAG: hypothetical protein KC454_06140 [Flavobacteriales bacterium]|nr:hypothetical protein [Flavobacteriales bacterium]